MEKVPNRASDSSEKIFPAELVGIYRLYLFVFSPEEKIVTRGRNEAEAREVFMSDPQTLESIRGRGFYIQKVDELSKEEQMRISIAYAESHPFDWEHTPPKVLLEKYNSLSRNV